MPSACRRTSTSSSSRAGSPARSRRTTSSTCRLRGKRAPSSAPISGSRRDGPRQACRTDASLKHDLDRGGRARDVRARSRRADPLSARRRRHRRRCSIHRPPRARAAHHRSVASRFWKIVAARLARQRGRPRHQGTGTARAAGADRPGRRQDRPARQARRPGRVRDVPGQARPAALSRSREERARPGVDAGGGAAHPRPQSRDGGAADLGAVHARSQAQASAAPGERPHAVSARRERRHHLRRVSRALCGARPAGADRDHCGGGTSAAGGAAGRDSGKSIAILASCASGRDVRSKIMKAWHFSENAYPYLPPAEEYESIRVSLPNRIYDPKKGAALYDRYIDEWLVAEDEGVEIMLNEHHQTATCVDPAAPLVLAALARLTKTARLLILGNPVANRRQPVRVAEEMAMVVMLSK